jgi:NTE family protein
MILPITITTVVDTLILEGGGVNCIATGGALKLLEERDILKNITKYAGTSAGSILCVLLCIGYTTTEIQNTLFKQNNRIIKNFIDDLLIPYNLFRHFGLYNPKKFIKYISTLFVSKGIPSDITFIELANRTGKTLTITGTSFTIQDTIYFNHYTYPNFKVIDAIRISMSIPLYFTSITHNLDGIDHVFGDGGVLSNFPYYYYIVCEAEKKYKSTFQELAPIQIKFYENLKLCNCISDDVTRQGSNTNSNIIGIMLIQKGYQNDFYKFYNGFNIIKNLTDYINVFIETMLSKIRQDNFTNPLTGDQDNFFDRTIVIELPKKVSPVNFNIDQCTKDLFVNTGYDKAKKFLGLN